MAMTSSNTGTGFKHDIQGVGRDLETLKNDAGNLMHGAADAARSGVAELRDGAHNAVDAAKGKLEDARKATAEAAHSMKEMIVRNPVTSIGIAAGVGILIGMVLCRSRS